MANLNSKKKYHFTYKTTNLLTGKFYIGIHSTSNLADGYLGSGKRLRYSIRKYGKENFEIQILEFFPSRKLLVEQEKKLVNKPLLQDPMCLNLKPGGEGGFCSEKHEATFRRAAKLSAQTNKVRFQKQQWLRKHDPEWNRKRIAAIKASKKKNPKVKPFLGKKHTKETKKQIGLTNSIKQLGTKNSQYNTRWITNGAVNRKIKTTSPIPEGFFIGRKLKN